MDKIVVFGAGDIAELAKFYFDEQGRHKVVAFVVDDEYRDRDVFCESPLIGLSELAREYPATEYAAFVAIGYAKMNTVREAKYKLLKEKGYRIVSYMSPHCHCFTKAIGENCFILEDNTIQPFVKVGNNVTMWSGCHIGHHSVIADNCFITSHVVVSGGVTIEENCFIGVNATLRDHIHIGSRTLIGAGALVLKDTETSQVLKGEPAKVATRTSDEIGRI